MQKSIKKQYFTIVIILSLAIALTIRFPMVMAMIFGNYGDEMHHGFSVQAGFGHFLVEFFMTFIVALLMFTMNYFILKPTEKHGNLSLLKIILAICLTIVSVYILNNLLFGILDKLDPEPPRRGRRNEFDLTNFFVSALVVGCVMVIRLVFQKQNIMVENESLKREALQSQFESLKNQLSPHFLFNSLTALKTLIQEAPDKAQNYINSLSKALRYTLQSNEKQLVTLGEEMAFMESYLYLIRMRYDTNLTVSINLKEDLLSSKIPPLTIQTLVENAIKHNEISKRKPLKIEIFTTENDNLRVVNDIQKKLTGEEGTGIGLTNLTRQFQLLIGKEVVISQENNQFVVEIPLIRQ